MPLSFFPSCRGSVVRAKFRLMGIGMKRFFVSAAICLIALQTTFLGIAQLASRGSSAVDPFLIICRSEGQPHASNNGARESDDHRPTQGCVHSVLCNIPTTPLVPSVVISAPRIGSVFGCMFARGPPQFVIAN